MARAALLGCAVTLMHGAATAQCRGVLLDPNGEPLAAGSKVEAGIVLLGTAYGLDPVRPLVVGDGGTITVPGLFPLVGPHGPRTAYLHVRRTIDGRRERVLTEVKAPALGQLRLVPEERLATGVVVDAHAKAVPSYAYGLAVERSPAAEEAARRDPFGVLSIRRSIGPRWQRGDFGRFELWGWRFLGEHRLSASYHGLELECARQSLPLEFGDNVRFELPATGHLQVRLRCPDGFPETSGAFAVLRALDDANRERSADQRRWLMARRPSNLRALTGSYAVTIEVNGKVVRDLGRQVVRHAKTTEVRADLRDITRVLRLSVRDERGEPIHAARAAVAGSPDKPFSRSRVMIDGERHWLITLPICIRDRVLPTREDRVDVELPYRMTNGRPVFGAGPQTIVVRGIEGDAVLTLQEPKAAGESWSFMVQPLD